MPGKLKVKVVAGRDLPVMDRSSDLTDAFVEVRFRNEIFKTEVFKKSLKPQWNSEWFKFEVEDEALQDEPLELRILDHDTYSAHDAIGKLYIDLNPLLTKDSTHIINGWFPIYDTMHGIRGELNIIVKVDLFSDVNKFRQSSCGIQFYSTAEVPSGFRLQVLHGFVEELVVNDDPEYQWIDKIRTPRASNEARQRLFSKLSGELQRKIGLKVLEMGGNSVIGYCQCFDLEGESGIVVRGIGTAVTLCKQLAPPSPLGISPLLKDLRHAVSSLHCQSSRSHIHLTRVSPPLSPLKHAHFSSNPPPSAPPFIPHNGQTAFSFPFSSPVPEDTVAPSSPPTNVVRCSTSPVKVSFPSVQRKSSVSESDISNITPPKGNSLTGSSGSGSGTGSGGKSLPKIFPQQNIDLMEFPLFTMTSFPSGFIVHLGGVVSAKSVKLLDKIHNPEEPETRDVWWTEIRTEIRSHMKAMGCHAVLGYSEQTSICDEIIILSATGTAARVNLNFESMQPMKSSSFQPTTTIADKVQLEKDRDKKLFVDVNLANQMSQKMLYANSDGMEDVAPPSSCSLCHIPYKTGSSPFPVKLSLCAICHKKKVPDVLFTTIDPPQEIQTYGKGSLIQARICRTKFKGKGESCAKEISDSLPFLEYELHNQLMSKLKLRGMNGLFGLKIQISVGETLLIGVATATAAFFSALPQPSIPKVTGQATSEKETNQLNALQKKITDTVQRNREIHDLLHIDTGQTSPQSVTTDDSDDDVSDLELSSGNKNTYILEVDDARDENIASLLNDSVVPEGFEVCNTQFMPGSGKNITSNQQMFTHVFRREFYPSSSNRKAFSDIFEKLIKKICFKLRKMVPCCLYNIHFNIDLPEDDEMQITVTGACIGVGDQETRSSSSLDLHVSNRSSLLKTVNSDTSEQDDMMFQMEEVSESANSQSFLKVSKTQKTEGIKRSVHHRCSKHKVGVELTPLAYVPGGQIDRYLGNYNFFFIRETTSLREMGGLGGFMHSFIFEVLANVRANVSSLGGNGLVAYKMSQCVLLYNPHKNQSQCLINVSGDVVSISYEGTDFGPEQLTKTGDSPIVINSST